MEPLIQPDYRVTTGGTLNTSSTQTIKKEQRVVIGSQGALISDRQSALFVEVALSVKK